MKQIVTAVSTFTSIVYLAYRWSLVSLQWALICRIQILFNYYALVYRVRMFKMSKFQLYEWNGFSVRSVDLSRVAPTVRPEAVDKLNPVLIAPGWCKSTLIRIDLIKSTPRGARDARHTLPVRLCPTSPPFCSAGLNIRYLSLYGQKKCAHRKVNKNT